MITLYQFAPIWNLPNGSPYCIKLETYLRLAKIPYQTLTLNDPRKAPKGKLPYIKDGEKIIGDSSLIIDYLKEKYGDALDQELTEDQKATALCVQRLLENHLYWILFYGRWVDNKGWNAIKNKLFAKMPLPLRWFVPQLIRNNFKKRCDGQGVGRFTDEERFDLGKKDIEAIMVLLGESSFFFLVKILPQLMQPCGDF